MTASSREMCSSHDLKPLQLSDLPPADRPAPVRRHPAEILGATIAAPLPDPREHAPDLTAPVSALVRRMTALDRESRPADGQAAADAIEALL